MAAVARRFRDLIQGWVEDLRLTEGDLTNTMRLQLRNAAKLQVEIDFGLVDDAIRAQGLVDRKLWALGLGKRKRQDLGPDMSKYLKDLKKASGEQAA